MTVSAANFFLAATLATAGFVSAAPPQKIGTLSKGSVGAGKASLKQVRRENYTFNGAVSVYKTYLKFGKQPPAALVAAVANITGLPLDKRDHGSAVTTPIDSVDDAYITPVQIGTPPQTLNLDFDTGSSDLWVFSSETASEEVKGQSTYNPSKSSTAKKLSNSTWDISYGDGSSCSGDVWTDKVSIGGVTVNKQAVEAAKQVSSTFTQDKTTDGLVGLGFDSLNTVQPTAQKTFFSNVLSSLDAPVFTADLKHNEPGTYDFGFIDDSKHTGSITYVDVQTDPGYWTWTSSGYAVGSGSFKSSSIDGIADTGTTLLYLPDDIVDAYYSKVKGSSYSDSDGGYIFPCTSTTPSFTFGVGSARITIPGKYIDFGPSQEGSSSCFGGLQSSYDVGTNIFGDVALKAAFVVFKGGDKPTLGWAPKTL